MREEATTEEKIVRAVKWALETNDHAMLFRLSTFLEQRASFEMKLKELLESLSEKI